MGSPGVRCLLAQAQTVNACLQHVPIEDSNSAFLSEAALRGTGPTAKRVGGLRSVFRALSHKTLCGERWHGGMGGVVEGRGRCGGGGRGIL